MKPLIPNQAREVRKIIVLIGMHLTVGAAWWQAIEFDPYTASFFTKTYVEPTPEMPRDMRIIGWICLGVGALIAIGGVQGFRKATAKAIDLLTVIWLAVLIAAFGGAFFVAANSAQARISEELAA